MSLHRTVRSVTALALMLAAGTAAQAHITFAEPSAAPGSYYAGFLRVSHGCAGSATVSIRVQMPDGVAIVRPQPKPGWTLRIEKAPLATPIRGEGGEVRERVVAVTWSGRLDADQFDQFGLLLKLPDRPGALYFPTVQQCETGRNDWTAIPAAGQPWHSVRNPAPVLTVTGAAAASMGAMKM